MVPYTVNAVGNHDVRAALSGVGNYTNTNCCSTSPTRGSFTVTGGSDDSDGPTFPAVTVSPSTATPGDQVTIEIAAGDESGVSQAGFYFDLDGAQRDICGQSAELVSGDEFNGVWAYVCTIPALVQNGTYTVIPYGVDAVGNNTNTNCCSTSPTRATLTVTGGSDDNTGPAFPSVTVSPSSVGPGDQLVINIRATDDAGVAEVGFTFELGGAQRDICGQQTELISGDASDGVWSYTCTIPDVVQGGEYTVVPYGVDVFGNYTNTNCCSTSPTQATFTVE